MPMLAKRSYPDRLQASPPVTASAIMTNMVEYEFCVDQRDNDIEAINHLLSLLTSNSKKLNPLELDNVCRNSKFLVARVGTEKMIIGMATLAVIEIPTGRFGMIEDVVVDDQFRGQGIGKSLVMELIKEAKALGLERVDLTSNPKRLVANQMYQDLGFSKVDTNFYRLKLEI